MKKIENAINTKQFGNKLENTFDELIDDPYKWAIMRQLAYASIRDDTIKFIEQVSNNSADSVIYARDLIQGLKAKNINQYVRANTVIQHIDLTDESQLNNILLNSNVQQYITQITRTELINQIQKVVSSKLTSFLGNDYVAIINFPNQPHLNKSVSFSTLVKMREYIINDIITKYEVKGYKLKGDYKTPTFINIQDKKHKTKKGSKTKKDTVYTFNIKGTNYQNYRQQLQMFDTTTDYVIYELSYGEEQDEDLLLEENADLEEENKRFYIILLLLNVSLYKHLRPTKKGDVVTLGGSLFGEHLSDPEKINDFLERTIPKKEYDEDIGRLIKQVQGVDKLFKTQYVPGDFYPKKRERPISDYLFGKVSKEKRLLTRSPITWRRLVLKKPPAIDDSKRNSLALPEITQPLAIDDKGKEEVTIDLSKRKDLALLEINKKLKEKMQSLPKNNIEPPPTIQLLKQEPIQEIIPPPLLKQEPTQLQTLTSPSSPLLEQKSTQEQKKHYNISQMSPPLVLSSYKPKSDENLNAIKGLVDSINKNKATFKERVEKVYETKPEMAKPTENYILRQIKGDKERLNKLLIEPSRIKKTEPVKIMGTTLVQPLKKELEEKPEEESEESEEKSEEKQTTLGNIFNFISGRTYEKTSKKGSKKSYEKTSKKGSKKPYEDIPKKGGKGGKGGR